MAIYRGAALQGQPSPVVSSFSFSVPLTLAQIQLGSPMKPYVRQYHRFHAVLQDGYVTIISSWSTLPCTKALQLPVVHGTTGANPSASGFTGRAFLASTRQKKKKLIITNRKCWIRERENSRYLIRGGVSKGFPGSTAKAAVTAPFARSLTRRQPSSDALMDEHVTWPLFFFFCRFVWAERATYSL